MFATLEKGDRSGHGRASSQKSESTRTSQRPVDGIESHGNGSYELGGEGCL
jgi:hypothetical protein